MNLTQAVAALDKGSPEKIAAFLYAEGITGVQDKACLCPVARFLTAAMGEQVAVTKEEAMTYDGVHTKDGVGLPSCVTAFVVRFDDGEFPGLISPEPPISVVD